MQQDSAFAYAAFISYRHLPGDAAVARVVQEAIEGFRLPRGVRGCNGGASRLGKCFRDEDELAASPSLPDSIREALEQSRTLVLICSPETSESDWVRREVETFEKLHGRDRIICVLAAGTSETSIPPYLRTRLVPDAHGVLREMPAEPLAADLRPESRPKRKAEMLRIIAAVAGCSFDDLRRRERARRRRRVGLGIAGAALVLGLVTLLAFSSHTSSQAALVAESENLARLSQEQFDRGDRMEALRLALAALPESETDGSRPLVPAAQDALEQALLLTPDPATAWAPAYAIKAEAPVCALAFADDIPLVAVLQTTGVIEVHHIESGALMGTIDPLSAAPEAFSRNVLMWHMEATHTGKLLLWSTEDGSSLLCFDLVFNGKLAWQREGASPNAVAVASDEAQCAFMSTRADEIAFELIDTETGDVIAERSKDLPGCCHSEGGQAGYLTPHGKVFYCGLDGGIVGVPFDNEKIDIGLTGIQSDLHITSICAAEETIVATAFGITIEDGDSIETPYEVRGLAGSEPWTRSGTTSFFLFGPRNEWWLPGGLPGICGLVDAESPTAVCQLGSELAAFALRDGSEVYHETFATPIAASRALGDSAHSIALCTSDGTLDLRTLGGGASLTMAAKRTLPYAVYGAAFYLDGNTPLALVRPQDAPETVAAFILDLRERTSEDTPGLDELIEEAEATLAANEPREWHGALMPL